MACILGYFLLPLNLLYSNRCDSHVSHDIQVFGVRLLPAFPVMLSSRLCSGLPSTRDGSLRTFEANFSGVRKKSSSASEILLGVRDERRE